MFDQQYSELLAQSRRNLATHRAFRQRVIQCFGTFSEALREGVPPEELANEIDKLLLEMEGTECP